MIGVILLAAGASTRLGTPKQLLNYKGTTLLGFVLDTAEKVTDKIVIVLGAHAEPIQKSLGARKAGVVINANWKEGMGSSIRCGVQAMQQVQPAVDGIIILVCDQPYISPDLLQELINKKKVSGKKIIASAYNGTNGVPALFDSYFFPALLLLKGQEGAKKIIQQHPDDLETIDFANGNTDIDTVDDYERLRAKE